MIWRKASDSDLRFELVGSVTVTVDVEGEQSFAASDIGTVKVEKGDLLAIYWFGENPIPYTLDTCTDDNKIFYLHNPGLLDVGDIYNTQILPDCRTYSVQVEILTSKFHFEKKILT